MKGIGIILAPIEPNLHSIHRPQTRQALPDHEAGGAGRKAGRFGTAGPALACSPRGLTIRRSSLRPALLGMPVHDAVFCRAMVPPTTASGNDRPTAWADCDMRRGCSPSGAPTWPYTVRQLVSSSAPQLLSSSAPQLVSPSVRRGIRATLANPCAPLPLFAVPQCCIHTRPLQSVAPIVPPPRPRASTPLCRTWRWHR